jgi:hypothetical protein
VAPELGVKKIFRRRTRLTGERREQHKPKLYNLCSSNTIIRVFKPMCLGGTCIFYGGEVHIGFLCGNLRKRDSFKEPGVDVRIILKWIFQKCERAWTGLISLRLWTV